MLPIPLLATVMFLIAGGLGGMLQPQTGLFHESWAALLLALMVTIRRPENPWPAIIVGGLALMIRELALPMILAMGGLALLEKRWREAAGWALVVVLFGIYMTLHAHWVSEVVRPGDPASPGWSRMLGAQFALKSIAKVTFGIRLPDAIGAGLLILSLFGWASVKTGWALQGDPAARRLWRHARVVRPCRHLLLGTDRLRRWPSLAWRFCPRHCPTLRRRYAALHIGPT